MLAWNGSLETARVFDQAGEGGRVKYGAFQAVLEGMTSMIRRSRHVSTSCRRAAGDATVGAEHQMGLMVGRGRCGGLQLCC